MSTRKSEAEHVVASRCAVRYSQDEINELNFNLALLTQLLNLSKKIKDRKVADAARRIVNSFYFRCVERADAIFDQACAAGRVEFQQLNKEGVRHGNDH